MLENRHYTLIIDKSGSMSIPDKGGKSRWDNIQEFTLALASKLEKFEPDGITVYTFSTRFKRYENVIPRRVEQIFQENVPVGSTELASVLKDALQNYFLRKKSGQPNSSGETILVITDGQPNDQVAVAKTIIEAAQKIDNETELAISFIQVGNDPEVTQFLDYLNNELDDTGTKFGIVDKTSIEEIEETPLDQVLLRSVLEVKGGDTSLSTSYFSAEKQHFTEENNRVSKSNISSLLISLSARDSHVRSEAAIALGRIGDEAAVPALCNALATDLSPEVRRHAAEALGIIGSEKVGSEG